MKWEEVELGDIANFSQGQQIGIKDQSTIAFKDCDTFLRIVNYTQKDSELRYIPKQEQKFHVTSNDLIMVRYGAVGFVGRGLKGVIANNLFKINFDNELIEGDYLYRVLWSPKSQSYLKHVSQSTSMPALSFKTVAKLKIPLPPLPVQQKIAAILDAADDYRSKTKALLDKYDQLTQSIFLEMFGDPVRNEKGWEVKKLGEIANIISGYPFKSAGYKKHGIPICGGYIIMPEKIQWEKANYWDPNSDIELSNYFLEKNDIVLAMDRPWISSGLKIGVITTNKPALLIQRTARIRLKEELSDYVLSILCSNIFKKHCKPTETTIPHITLKEIKEMPIGYPNKSLIQEFNQRISKIKDSQSLLKNTLNNSNNLFQSLLQKAFKGELVN